MAGSGFPPLPNIPYCCLPQESGPCLSTSVGDRPLRSPSHRRLGGPSPRRPSNGTHARPRPRRRLALQGMPQKGFIPYYPAFPPAIRKTGVGCIRVTHPSATLAAPKGRLPYDLHVLGLPLAFILSQDQTLRCTIVSLTFFPSLSGPPSLLSVLSSPGSPPGIGSLSAWRFASRHSSAPRFLCWPQAIKELANPLPSFRPLVLSFAGAKVQPFPLPATLFLKYFCRKT